MPCYSIPGGYVVCDEEDASLLAEPGWRVTTQGKVVRFLREAGKGRDAELFHRMIMNCPEGLVVDHINGDTTDNRKSNLRICSQAENLRNRKVHKNNSSGVRGIYYDKSRAGGRPWRAQIRKDGKQYRIGSFETAAEAKAARVEAEIALFGDFAPSLCRKEA